VSPFDPISQCLRGEQQLPWSRRPAPRPPVPPAQGSPERPEIGGFEELHSRNRRPPPISQGPTDHDRGVDSLVPSRPDEIETIHLRPFGDRARSRPADGVETRQDLADRPSPRRSRTDLRSHPVKSSPGRIIIDDKIRAIPVHLLALPHAKRCQVRCSPRHLLSMNGAPGRMARLTGEP